MKKKNYADMDPLEEVRAIREELDREFPTLHEYYEHLRKKYPNSRPANWEPKPESPKLQPKSRRPVAKTAKRPALRHRKTSAHA